MPNPLTVLVTGASAGIGAATARAFTAAGDRVILAARSADRLRQLAGEIDGDTHVLPLDVADAQAHLDAVAGLPDGWRDIDVAVLNAGLAKGLRPVWENTTAEVDAMVDTNRQGRAQRRPGHRAGDAGARARPRDPDWVDGGARGLPRRRGLLRHQARRPGDCERAQGGPPRHAGPRDDGLARPGRDRLLARPLRRRRRPRGLGLRRHGRADAGGRGRRRGLLRTRPLPASTSRSCCSRRACSRATP